MKPIAITGEANIYVISALLERILKEWSGDSPLILDLSKIEDVDSSFVQLLLSCKRSTLEKSQKLELMKVPETLQAMFNTLHVNDFLNSTGDESQVRNSTLQEEDA
jgi:ABC-type transporter Mla MlaB component